MAKSQSAELLSKLKSSLPKPSVSDLSSVDAHESLSKTISATVLPTRAPKLSVSLYHTDLKRLDEIKEFMRSRGVRSLSDSEALRLACRAVQTSDEFLNIYKQMQAEDGRRRPDTATLGK